MTADTGQQPSLPAGTLLKHGDYRIDRLLGSGGFGNTYLAFDNNMQVACAIKEFFLDGYNVRQSNGTVTIGTGTRRDIVDKQREKFRTEALRLFRLKHTNIVGVHGFFEENGTAYYVMDFVKGQSLASLLKNNQGPFSEAKVMQEIMPQLLDALEYIHSQPEMVLHMDLKPENIMLRADGNVCLIDFGASKAFDFYSEDRPSTISSYTPLFAPPEQIDNLTEHIGPWTDFYALGGTLYELLTCKKPPRVSDVINRKDAAFDYSRVPQLSAKVRQLIRWMMQPERERRPQSVAEIRKALSGESVEQGVASDEPRPAHATIDDARTRLSSSSGALISMLKGYGKWALIAVALLVVIVIATRGCWNESEREVKATNEPDSLGLCPDANHPHAIDMGTGVKWACCNVGASSPVEYGDYFAWGETRTKTYYDWSTYSLCTGSYHTMTKYCNLLSFGTVDNKTQLDLSDDAARANWGASWRMPTIDEFSPLNTNCTWTWTTVGGVNGYKVTAKNGNVLFFPAAGCRHESGLYGAGSSGYYWSSSLDTSSADGARVLYFYSSDHYTYGIGRCNGLSVRPVTE